MYTDEQLIEGCRQNNRQWQERLYRQYFPTMMRMAMRYSQDKDAAMMIVNNGFLRVFKKIDKFNFKGSFEGWIRRIVYHSVSDYYKKNTKYLQFLVFEERDEQTKSGALENLYAEDIMDAVCELPPATQEVFRLYAIEGYSHAEVGEMLNISSGTSKWHLSSARKQLKELLKKRQNYGAKSTR